MTVMVEVIAIPKVGQRRLEGVGVDIGRYAIPVAVAVLFVVSSLLFAQRLDLLRTWSDTYAAAGEFNVESCELSDGFGADQWACQGSLQMLTLTANGDAVSQQSSLIASEGAYVSAKPVVGSTVPVFFNTADSATVYPDTDRIAEVARLYLSLLPRLFFAIGALVWLVGWYVTTVNEGQGVRRSRWFPQRFSWRTQGVKWLAAGVGVVVLNYVVVHKLVGSLGII